MGWSNPYLEPFKRNLTILVGGAMVTSTVLAFSTKLQALKKYISRID